MISCSQKTDDDQTPEYGQFDAILAGGTVYDGTGADGFDADVGIRDKRIAAIGDLGKSIADEVVDVHGLIVCPGFIDPHSYGGKLFPANRPSENSVRMGVTTEIWVDYSAFFDAGSMTLWPVYKLIGDEGVCVNVGLYVNENRMREHVMNNKEGPPSDLETGQMRWIVEKAMQDGAFGLSASLDPSTEHGEPESLAEAVSWYDGVLLSRLRSEGEAMGEAVRELADISQRTGVRAIIAHIKLGGPENQANAPAVVETIGEARSRGINIQAHQYPYTSDMTTIEIYLPPWAVEWGRETLLALLADPGIRDQIRALYRENMIAWAGDFSNVYIPCIGRTLAEESALRNIDPVEAALQLIEENPLLFICSTFETEKTLKLFMAQPYVSLCTAGGALPAWDSLYGSVHPRFAGTYPRFLARYVRDEGVMDLGEAVHKCTGLVADQLGIADRGLIREGNFADIAVFDLDALEEAAPDDPLARPHGMVHVLVNGAFVLRHGEIVASAKEETPPGMPVRHAPPGHEQLDPGTITFEAGCAEGRRATLAFVGDVLFGDDAQKGSELLMDPSIDDPDERIASGFRAVLSQVEDDLAMADLTVGNLESPVARNLIHDFEVIEGENVCTEAWVDPYDLFDDLAYGLDLLLWPHFNAHPALALALRDVGFDLVSTANNHSMDRCGNGIDLTIDALDRAGIRHVGTMRAGEVVDSDHDGWPENQPYIVEDVNGIRIAFFSIATFFNGDYHPDPGWRDYGRQVWTFYTVDRHSTLEYWLLKIAEAKARPDVDLVVVMPHKGLENIRIISDFQRRIYYRMVEAGADVIVAHHPHVIQQMEKHRAADGREVFVIYSLGDFVAPPTSEAYRSGAILYLEIVKTDLGASVSGVSYLPVYIRHQYEEAAGGDVLRPVAMDRESGLDSQRRIVTEILGTGNLKAPDDPLDFPRACN